jgi:hypothetical protein
MPQMRGRIGSEYAERGSPVAGTWRSLLFEARNPAENVLTVKPCPRRVVSVHNGLLKTLNESDAVGSHSGRRRCDSRQRDEVGIQFENEAAECQAKPGPGLIGDEAWVHFSWLVLNWVLVCVGKDVAAFKGGFELGQMPIFLGGFPSNA